MTEPILLSILAPTRVVHDLANFLDTAISDLLHHLPVHYDGMHQALSIRARRRVAGRLKHPLDSLTPHGALCIEDSYRTPLAQELHQLIGG